MPVTTQATTRDNLIAGDFPLVTDAETLIAGQNLVRGAVVGKITVSGKLTLSAAAAVDGSEIPYAILAADTDATAGDSPCVAYKTGEFSEGALTLGVGHTLAAIKDGLRDRGIFLKATRAA
ncbi:MAG: head decoration protein [Nitrospirota bacterium]|nr:head decoration protein [Nitrospirota bacterium]